jgi:ABC-type sugar transport system permease subunit
MLVLVGVVVLFPVGVAAFRSFYDWQPGSTSSFVGWTNYSDVLHSIVIREIVKNELVYMIGVPLWAGLPLVIALMLYDRVPFAGVFRTIFFFPSVLSPVMLGLLFRSMLQPDGLLNSMLSSIGLHSLAHAWIDDPGLVKPTIIVVALWYLMGFGVLIYSAALSAIPAELFEAAELDGAGWLQRLRYVVIPGILPTFILYAIISFANVFIGLFGIIYVLTDGGPGFASMTLDYEIFNQGTIFAHFGVAAAEAMLLLGILLLVFVALVVTTRITRRRYT